MGVEAPYTMSSKKLAGAQLRKFRSDVAKLKSKGLVSKRIDARGQKPTRYMLGQVKKYNDVLEGRAAVLHVKSKAKAGEFKEVFRTKFDAIVVPKEKGERVTYSKKTGDIRSTRTKYGQKIRKRILKIKINGPDDLRKLERKGLMFAIPLGTGTRLRFSEADDLIKFMVGYNYNNWWKYVELEETNEDEDEGE
jgi:hypothetical protein